MDAGIYTLMLVLAASGLDGTKVLVSIPEGTFHFTHNTEFYGAQAAVEVVLHKLSSQRSGCLSCTRKLWIYAVCAK